MNTHPWPESRCRQWLRIAMTALACLIVMTFNANARELRDCGHPSPSDDTMDFCESMGIPSTCFLSDLSDEEQRSCDQKRFQGAPHFNVVHLSPEGAVRAIHLLRTDTGRVVYTGYPHGTAFSAPDSNDSVVRMHTEFRHQYLAARPTPGSLTTTASSGYASGLSIGWNDSTGVTPGWCYNYTIDNPGSIYGSESFTSKNTASSSAEQIKLSATVSGSFGAFKLEDTFSYSDSYESSTNSSS